MESVATVETHCKASPFPPRLGSLRLPHFPQPRRRIYLQTINPGGGSFLLDRGGLFLRCQSETARQLKRFLGRSIQAVSGIRGEWDQDRPYPDRLLFVTFEDGTSVLDDARYSVAVNDNDFTWAGGDGLNELTAAEDVEDMGRLLRDVLADSIRQNPIVGGKVHGRIVARD